jgi:hypothetical protein
MVASLCIELSVVCGQRLDVSDGGPIDGQLWLRLTVTRPKSDAMLLQIILMTPSSNTKQCGDCTRK